MTVAAISGSAAVIAIPKLTTYRYSIDVDLKLEPPSQRVQWVENEYKRFFSRFFEDNPPRGGDSNLSPDKFFSAQKRVRVTEVKAGLAITSESKVHFPAQDVELAVETRLSTLREPPHLIERITTSLSELQRLRPVVQLGSGQKPPRRSQGNENSPADDPTPFILSVILMDVRGYKSMVDLDLDARFYEEILSDSRKFSIKKIRIEEVRLYSMGEFFIYLFLILYLSLRILEITIHRILHNEIG